MSVNNPDKTGIINISNLPQGSYLLNLKTENNGHRILKFIKQK